MPQVCVFDANETLLDLSALNPAFERTFGDTAARKEWFRQLVQSALVSTVTDAYTDFNTIGQAALHLTAARRGVQLSYDDEQRILQALRSLPPHPDVHEGLKRLRAAGLRLAVLTNSPPRIAEAQINNAGLHTYFEQVLSADSVQKLKPAPEPYRMAAERLGVEIGQIRLVAAHAWDVAGALRAGCAAAFIQRPGKALDPLAERPDVIGRDLCEVAEQIVQREGIATSVPPGTEEAQGYLYSYF